MAKETDFVRGRSISIPRQFVKWTSLSESDLWCRFLQEEGGP